MNVTSVSMRAGEEGVSDTRLAVPADGDRIASTIVAAFDRDPAFRAFFGHGADFAELATAFAGAKAAQRTAMSAVWVGAGGDAVALWSPPRGSADVPPVEVDLPSDVRARLAAYDEIVDAAVPTEPHWYLGLLASHPSRRGEGLARAVAEPGLAAAQARGVPAVLETTNPDNVLLYERSGWRVTAELDDVIGLPVWVMQIDPS